LDHFHQTYSIDFWIIFTKYIQLISQDKTTSNE